MTGKNWVKDDYNVGAATDKGQLLDKEWVILIQTAREQGLTIEEIRLFLKRVAASKAV